MSIILIHPYPGRPEADVRLSGILSHALADREGRTIRTAEELDLRPGDRVLFALALDGAGQNLEYYRMLSPPRRGQGPAGRLSPPPTRGRPRER